MSALLTRNSVAFLLLVTCTTASGGVITVANAFQSVSANAALTPTLNPLDEVGFTNTGTSFDQQAVVTVTSPVLPSSQATGRSTQTSSIGGTPDALNVVVDGRDSGSVFRGQVGAPVAVAESAFLLDFVVADADHEYSLAGTLTTFVNTSQFLDDGSVLLRLYSTLGDIENVSVVDGADATFDLSGILQPGAYTLELLSSVYAGSPPSTGGSNSAIADYDFTFDLTAQPQSLVAEPSSLALFGIGGLAFLIHLRRRRIAPGLAG